MPPLFKYHTALASRLVSTAAEAPAISHGMTILRGGVGPAACESGTKTASCDSAVEVDVSNGAGRLATALTSGISLYPRPRRLSMYFGVRGSSPSASRSIL